MDYWRKTSKSHAAKSFSARSFVEMVGNIIQDERSEEAYKIAKWFYSVDWMKFMVASEYVCDEPYLNKQDIHSEGG